MPTLQMSLPTQLWERLELYRRMRGQKLGLPVIDVQIAVEKLLERGLSAVGDLEPTAPDPESSIPDEDAVESDSPSQPLRASHAEHRTDVVGLDGPHHVSQLTSKN